MADVQARACQIAQASTDFLELINFGKPLVVAVNGSAVGLGLLGSVVAWRNITPSIAKEFNLVTRDGTRRQGARR